jgi:hypothetical protein
MLIASSAGNLQDIRMYRPIMILVRKPYYIAVPNAEIALFDKYIKGIKDYMVMHLFGNQEQKYGSR